MTQYTLSTIFIVGYNYMFISILSLISISFAIGTIISNNPVFSVLFLIGLFGSVSLYLVVAGSVFIGLSYLLIYIGAISILFIIILMLINIRISELLTNNNNSLLLAIFTLFCFNFLTIDNLPYNEHMYDSIRLGNLYFQSILDYIVSFIPQLDVYEFALKHEYTSNIAYSYTKIWDSMLVTSSHIISIGNTFYTNFFSLFMTLSLILLLAMIGAIIITTNKSNKKIFDLTLHGTESNNDYAIKSNIFANFFSKVHNVCKNVLLYIYCLLILRWRFINRFLPVTIVMLLILFKIFYIFNNFNPDFAFNFCIPGLMLTSTGEAVIILQTIKIVPMDLITTILCTVGDTAGTGDSDSTDNVVNSEHYDANKQPANKRKLADIDSEAEQSNNKRLYANNKDGSTESSGSEDN